MIHEDEADRGDWSDFTEYNPAVSTPDAFDERDDDEPDWDEFDDDDHDFDDDEDDDDWYDAFGDDDEDEIY